MGGRYGGVHDIAEQLDEIEEEDTEDIEKKKQLYDELRQSETFQREKLAYDIWTAAFYWPMDGSVREYPTPSTIEKIRRNPDPKDEGLENLIERAIEISEDQLFFHWELEFPEVFKGGSGGFDSIIGNPPWEKPKLVQKEWFSGKNGEIASSDSKSERERLIDELKEENPILYEKWEKAQRRTDQTLKFLRESGRYSLSGQGDLNTYPIFTELASEYLVEYRDCN